ncbi:hypothetical protein Hanom_Chr08g00738331 [Helianthus anomalus]
MSLTNSFVVARTHLIGHEKTRHQHLNMDIRTLQNTKMLTTTTQERKKKKIRANESKCIPKYH